MMYVQFRIQNSLCRKDTANLRYDHDDDDDDDDDDLDDDDDDDDDDFDDVFPG